MKISGSHDKSFSHKNKLLILLYLDRAFILSSSSGKLGSSLLKGLCTFYLNLQETEDCNKLEFAEELLILYHIPKLLDIFCGRSPVWTYIST